MEDNKTKSYYRTLIFTVVASLFSMALFGFLFWKRELLTFVVSVVAGVFAIIVYLIYVSVIQGISSLVLMCVLITMLKGLMEKPTKTSAPTSM